MMRLNQEVCIGVLGIKALALPESDLAAFLHPPEPGLVTGSSLGIARLAGNRVVVSVRVRVFANGKVCIEMRPPDPKPCQGTGSE